MIHTEQKPSFDWKHLLKTIIVAIIFTVVGNYFRPGISTIAQIILGVFSFSLGDRLANKKGVIAFFGFLLILAGIVALVMMFFWIMSDYQSKFIPPQPLTPGDL